MTKYPCTYCGKEFPMTRKGFGDALAHEAECREKKEKAS